MVLTVKVSSGTVMVESTAVSFSRMIAMLVQRGQHQHRHLRHEDAPHDLEPAEPDALRRLDMARGTASKPARKISLK